MSKRKEKPDGKSGEGNAVNEALMQKLRTLNEHLEAIERSKKQRNLVSVVGLLLIILAIAFFIMNVTNFAKELSHDSDYHKELLTTLGKDLREVKDTNPHLKGMLVDLKSEIIPYLSDKIVERFKEEVPQFKSKGGDFVKDMEQYLENDVKSKLVKSLAKSLVDVEGVLKEKYPDISPDDIEKVLNSARATFVIEITNIIETRIDSIRLELDGLKESVSKFKDCDEYKELDHTNPNTMDYVKLQMVESMLELVIYQINPHKGRTIVGAVPGGVR